MDSMKLDGTLLDFSTLNKPQKIQAIGFIRKTYSCANINLRDIISNRYQAVMKDGKLVAVAFRL